MKPVSNCLSAILLEKAHGLQEIIIKITIINTPLSHTVVHLITYKCNTRWYYVTH